MGDIEILFAFITILIVINLIFIILKYIFYKNIISIYNINKNNKHNFYECGIKPISQNVITFNLNYILLSIFFMLYDSELLFIIPIIYNFNFFTLLDVILIFIYLLLIIISLIIDFQKNALV